MSGYCEECGNDVCICRDISIEQAEERGYQRGLAERDERVRVLETLLRWLDQRCGLGLEVHERISGVLAASAPAGECRRIASARGRLEDYCATHVHKTSESAAATSATDASGTNADSPPAEAPSRAGVPSGSGDAEIDSPNFVSDAQRELQERGFVRVNRPGKGSEVPSGSAEAPNLVGLNARHLAAYPDSNAEYERLVRSRKCTPEEQAGPDARICPECWRRTMHQHVTDYCMACHWLTANTTNAKGSK